MSQTLSRILDDLERDGRYAQLKEYRQHGVHTVSPSGWIAKPSSGGHCCMITSCMTGTSRIRIGPTMPSTIRKWPGKTPKRTMRWARQRRISYAITCFQWCRYRPIRGKAGSFAPWTRSARCGKRFSGLRTGPTSINPGSAPWGGRIRKPAQRQTSGVIPHH